jgi:SAM-dependent methyltransferase
VELPTSSASAPAVVAVMLDRLDVRDGMRVLEIGTGTGYNAALMAHRIGGEHVYSIDIDPTLVAAARQALHGVGLHPTLVAADGYNPVYVILSCFMQHFGAPDFVLLCRDLPSLAAAYRRAFDCWFREAEILQPSAREVRYEIFVTDFESQLRAIADFLGLAWTDAMLEPGGHAQGKGFISAPSYSQVVQPVNTRAIGRWKSYEKHFTEVIPQLGPYFDRWDYGT